jgi:hypothetical protein
MPEFRGVYPEGTPDYVTDALNRTGLPCLESAGAIEFETVNIFPALARADFGYRGRVNFCELTLELAGHRSHWVLYGEPPRVHDAGGALRALLLEDLAQLDVLCSGRSSAFPWFHRRARRVVTPFMESEVHQEIVDADHEGLAPDAIVEKINRALPAAYVERSLARLRQIARTAGRWSSLKWSLGIVVADMVCAILAVVAIEHANPPTLHAGQYYVVLYPQESAPESLWLGALLTVALSAVGWLLARWVSLRWIKLAGRERLCAWARRKGLLMSTGTVLVAIVVTAALAVGFFAEWPIWMDKEGRLYGSVAVLQPPQLDDSRSRPAR